MVKAYLLLAGGFLAIALGQTALDLNQTKNIPQLAGQFGFACITIGASTTCQVDSSYMLNLALQCPTGGLPCPNGFSPGVAPPPGPCPSSAWVIVTNEPAAYFCAPPPLGSFGFHWIRFSGVNTW